MIAIASLYLHLVGSSTRMIWVKERSSTWREQVVNWLENVSFCYLCDELQSGIEKQYIIIRRAVSTEERVALRLWFLATGADYRTIGH